MEDERTPRTWRLFAAFAAVVLCFLGATVYSQMEARQIGVLSESLSRNAMPSIEQLAAARADLRRLQALASSSLLADDAVRGDTLRGLIDTKTKIDLELDAYLRLPIFPGEEALWQEIRESLSEVDAAVGMTRAYADASQVRRAAAAVQQLDTACERANTAILMCIELNARGGQRIAMQIEEVRRRALWGALGLDGASVVMTVILALLVVRAVSGHERLLRKHNALLALRADELEQFAGRVAHDIRNPLNAVTLNLGLIERRAAGDEKIQGLAARALSNVGRASRLLDGLLAFARAGARPAEDARADVQAVLGSMVDDLRATAALSRVELTCEPLPDGEIRCDPSILEVIVSNLVRNAIKYIGDGPERRITVRARDAGSFVRVEVEDTGVGVPAELRDAIFKPYVRGPTHGQPGIGLGLATVKRICDTHGGRTGVEPAGGAGSCFWFEMPRAASRAANGRPGGPTNGERAAERGEPELG